MSQDARHCEWRGSGSRSHLPGKPRQSRGIWPTYNSHHASAHVLLRRPFRCDPRVCAWLCSATAYNEEIALCQGKAVRRRHQWVLWTAIALVLLAAIAFAAGCLLAANALGCVMLTALQN